MCFLSFFNVLDCSRYSESLFGFLEMDKLFDSIFMEFV